MKTYDLLLVDSPDDASQLAQRLFGASLTAYTQIGQGFYGVVYRGLLDRAPGQVIFKWQKIPGSGLREKRNLDLLRQYARLKIPEVYQVFTEADGIPGECVVMESLPGVTASKLQFPDRASLANFLDEIIENLYGWHAVSNPAGFGELEGPFYPTWPEFYRARIEPEYELFLTEGTDPLMTGLIRQMAEETYARLDRILIHCARRSSLLHSDYNIWNYMADPLTCRVTGIIDPMLACWGDREMDLFHLFNGPGAELGLLERYLRDTPPDPEFYLRSYFYRFWDDIHHYNALPGPLRPLIVDALMPYAQRLKNEMQKAGLA